MITWKLSNGRLIPTSNDYEALQSTIHNLLTIPSGEFDIFSWNYGNQLLNILANSEICEKIEEYITQCVTFDDRIESVKNIDYEKVLDSLYITFEADTPFGIIKNEVIF